MSLQSSNSLFGFLELSYKVVYYTNDDNNNYLYSYNLLKWSWQFKDISCCLSCKSQLNPAVDHASSVTWTYSLEYLSSIQCSESYIPFFRRSRIYLIPSFWFWIQPCQSIGESHPSLVKVLQENKGSHSSLWLKFEQKGTRLQWSNALIQPSFVDRWAVEVYSNSQIFAAMIEKVGELLLESVSLSYLRFTSINWI
jgi:hypothetical protein